MTPSELVPCAHSCGLGRWSYKKVRRGGDCKHHQNYMNWWRSGFPKEQQLGSPKQHMADTLTISISLIDPDFFWSHDINICQAKMSINYSEIQTLSSIFYFLCYMFCEEKKKAQSRIYNQNQWGKCLSNLSKWKLAGKISRDNSILKKWHVFILKQWN